MKPQILVIALGILAAFGVRAEPAAKIIFGTPIRKVFPADGPIERRVYIELPVTITNTSAGPIRFCTNPGPQYLEYVQRKTGSRRWYDITPRGMCGVGLSAHDLGPGESLKDTQLVQLEYGGRGYRLDLPIYEPETDRSSTIKSEAIVLPVFKDEQPRRRGLRKKVEGARP
jgi:hypothetical protein